MSIVLDGTTGITTPGLTNTGTETLVNLTTTGNTILGDASTDTLNVGNGGLVKDASGNVSIGTASPSASYGRLTVSGSGISITPDTAAKFQIGRYSAGAPYSYIKMGSTSSGLKFTDPADSVDLMTLDSSGNLGLGVTAPQNKLQVVTTTRPQFSVSYNGTTGLYLEDATNSSWKSWKLSTSFGNGSDLSFVQSTNTSGTPTWAATAAMTLDASGNWILGGTTARTRLTLQVGEANAPTLGTASGGAFFGNSNVSYGTLFGTSGSGYGWIQQQRVDGSGTAYDLCIQPSGGNLLVGKTALNLAVGTSIDANTSTGSGVRVVSSATTASADGFQMYSTGTSTYRFAVGFNGTISAVSTVISSISDARLKENVRDLNVGLSEIMALKPRLYDWKEGKGADIKNARGFIAQEFEIVFPDLIDESRDPAPEGEGPYKAVRADLIPVLVKAIQEQQAIIQSLTDRLTALENK